MAGLQASTVLGWLGLCVAGCDVGPTSVERPWALDVVLDEAERVPTGGPIRVALDRRLSPWSIDRGTVGLSSGAVGEFVFPWFDPLTNELVVELTRPMLANTAYVLTLGGLQDLDGFALDTPKRILIVSSAMPTDLPPPVTRVGFSEVSELFVARCAGASCHGAAEGAAELVLEGARGIAATAKGRLSPQSSSGRELPESRAAGLVDLAIIDDEGASSSVSFSYLIYKVLGDQHVLGERMPPPSTGDSLASDELALIARWIRTGAALE